MRYHQGIEHIGILKGAAHEACVLHGSAVIGYGDNTGKFQLADVCQHFSLESAGDRADRIDVYASVLLCAA